MSGAPCPACGGAFWMGIPHQCPPFHITTTATMPDDDWVCGDSQDHDLTLISSRDGLTAYECRTCGAEIVEDDDDA